MCRETPVLAQENLPAVYDSEKWSNLVVSSSLTGKNRFSVIEINDES